jgi:hypothetical protein
LGLQREVSVHIMWKHCEGGGGRRMRMRRRRRSLSLCIGFPSGLCTLGHLTEKFLNAFLTCPMCAAFPFHLLIVGLITVIVFVFFP